MHRNVFGVLLMNTLSTVLELAVQMNLSENDHDIHDIQQIGLM